MINQAILMILLAVSSVLQLGSTSALHGDSVAASQWLKPAKSPSNEAEKWESTRKYAPGKGCVDDPRWGYRKFLSPLVQDGGTGAYERMGCDHLDLPLIESCKWVGIDSYPAYVACKKTCGCDGKYPRPRPREMKGKDDSVDSDFQLQEVSKALHALADDKSFCKMAKKNLSGKKPKQFISKDVSKALHILADDKSFCEMAKKNLLVPKEKKKKKEGAAKARMKRKKEEAKKAQEEAEKAKVKKEEAKAKEKKKKEEGAAKARMKRKKEEEAKKAQEEAEKAKAKKEEAKAKEKKKKEEETKKAQEEAEKAKAKNKNRSSQGSPRRRSPKLEAKAPVKWVKGQPGAICASVCGAIGKVCDSSLQSQLTSNEAVKQAFKEAGYECTSFHPARSYAGTPFSRASKGDCSPIIPGATSTCIANRHSHHSPLCACIFSEGAQKWEQFTQSTRDKDTEDDDKSESSSPSRRRRAPTRQ